MVNWQEAGKTWPQPHPHAVRLLRGLEWDQHYRHSHPQCKGGMPGSFELREDMGADRLQGWKTGCGWKGMPTASARSAGGSEPDQTGPAKDCAPTGLRRTRTRTSTHRAPRSTSPCGT